MAFRQAGRQGLRQLGRLSAAASGTGAGPLQAQAYSSAAGGGGGSRVPLILGLTGVGAGLYFAKEYGYLDGVLGAPPTAKKADGGSFKPDYKAVREAIADVMEKDEDYDDGSYGPILVRLAWHSSGTYKKEDGTGGSNGATMRFRPEAEHSANAGLHVARELLEPVKKQFPWISYSDLWTLAGCVAVEEMGGPHIEWSPGRSDKVDGAACPEDGRLPDASKGAPHIRDVFNRMGFNDREIVALSGAHALGRCHTDRSGFSGPWTNAPTTFSNLYFTEMLEKKWRKKKWNGPLQYEDESGQLMMLPTDLALVWDTKLRPYVEEYAKDGDKFFTDFAAAYHKLLHLGVPVSEPGKHAPA
eukprot:jgi/Astpho2/8407/Aster-01462